MEIKKITKNIKMLTEEDLALLIPAAQKGDDYAMEQICLCFSPLIYKISHRQTVYNVLGEEAVNILWVWFLETIHSYTGNDFRKFPGFVRKHLVLRLMNIFKYYNIRFNSEQLSTMDEDTSVVEIPAGDEYGNLLDKLSLEQEFNTLSEQQYSVIKKFYVEHASIEQIATALKMAPRTVRYHRAKAVACLQKRLVASL